PRHPEQVRPALAERPDQSTELATHPVAAHSAPLSHGVSHAAQAHVADAPQRAEPHWHAVEQVAQHIERMVYERERDAITVRLDPPELGVIEVRIQATGSEVQAWVSAERDQTRQLLQQAHQQLREQLESRGLHLTHFDVGGQSHSRFAQARPSRTPAIQSLTHTHPSTATDSLFYDGRWSVWV
ncbi:MAG: flagellar hook-length control protein FliK, partial [Fimbriimonadales bacterium]|nr:flagellar hook-length control protein FliK [Fimbriimonadales bacterium]